MRHDTRAALQKLRDEIDSQARALDGMSGWSLSAGRVADEHRSLSSKIAKVLEDDARACAIEEEAGGFTVLGQSVRPDGGIDQTVRMNASGREENRVWTADYVAGATYGELREALYGKKP